MPVQTRTMYKAKGITPKVTRVIERNRRSAVPLVDPEIPDTNDDDRDSNWSTISTSTSASSRKKLELERKKMQAERDAARARMELLNFRAEEAEKEISRQQRLADLEVEAELEETHPQLCNDVLDSRSQERQVIDNLERDHGHVEEPPTLEQQRCQQWVNSSRDPMDCLTRALATLTSAVAENQRKDIEVKTYLARHHGNVELPSFCGDPEEWATFYTTLMKTTSQFKISDEENIRRLQKCLGGKAKESVRAMLMSSSSLKDIVDVLERRFGRPKVIINALLEKARNMVSPRDGDQEDIVDFSIAVKNLCSTAQALKYKHYLYNPQLLDELVRKLPDYMVLDWARFSRCIPEVDVNLQDFSDFLDELAQAVVRVCECPEKELYGEVEDKPMLYQKFKGNKHIMSIEETSKCAVGCKHNHETVVCEKFKKMKTDERWDLIKKCKLCFCCLQRGHMTRDCPRKLMCNTDGCKSFHHRLLHWKSKVNPIVNVIEENQICSNLFLNHEKEIDYLQAADGVIGTVNSSYQKILMKVLPVVLHGPLGSMKVNAYLDEGAAVTLIDHSVANVLGLQGPKTSLDLGWIDNTESKDSTSRKVSLQIAGVPESFDDKSKMKVYALSDVYTKKNLSLPSQPLEHYKLWKHWKHLEGLPFAALDNRKPVLLIGQDHVGLIMSLKSAEGKMNEPVASFTRLGWVVHGNPKTRHDGKKFAFCVHQKTDDDILHEMVKDQFKLDSLGIMNTKHAPRSKEDGRAEELMEKLSRRVDGHWETGLLWKSDNIEIPESYKDAFRRLRILERDMDKDDKFGKLYCSKIQEYLEKGFCHKLTPEEAAVDNGRVRYIAHFGTTNPNKPGKLRFVVDCKAKANGVGLNDCLLQGPDLMTPLISVLARFRSREVGFSGDIKDMFHMFRIRNEDKPAQRFLWRGMNRCDPPDVYCMDVMMFGAVSSPYQAQWLKNKNAEEFRNEFGSTTDAIVLNHYVDDYLDSAGTKEEATKKIKDVIEIHRRGGMEIRGWLCNAEGVLKAAVPHEIKDRNSVLQNSKEMEMSPLFDEEKLERVLGMYWNPTKDSFQFSLKFRTTDQKITSGEKTPTKREILKMNASLFDPLGLIGHLTVRGKILMQDVWRTGVGWDDEIGPVLEEKWKKFYENLQQIPYARIPRCYAANISKASDIQLHVFNDASDKAMCSSAYFRVTSSEDNRITINTCIVIARTRVAPLRAQSIPRLELQAALMGSRLVEFVKESHDFKIDSIYLWSDSKTVLAWLRADDPRRFKPFVSHRLGEIMEHTDVSMWKWVPTKENVADEGTRDVGTADLSPESRFFKGPAFLKMDCAEWQFENEGTTDVNDESLEIKKFPMFVIAENDFAIDITKFSRWRRLIRVSAWIIRYMENLRKSPQKSNSKWLLVRELKSAEIIWIRKVQQESFPVEHAQLSNGDPVDKTSRLRGLSPVVRDGVICISSRLVMSKDIPIAAKYPIILDPKHRWTKLLLDDYHVAAGHHGQEMVCNELRQKYWILDMRTSVRSAWNRCVECRLSNAKPEVPEMAALPEMRVTVGERPFTFVGMDYFGPIETTYLRRRMKRYGVIFTCLQTRAVHLEMAYDLTTDSTIMTLHRFISRRGEPKEIWSDNGTNLRGAANELKSAIKEIDPELIANDLTGKGVNWHFIPPSAPHMGGSWERLIRCVKTAMSAIMKNCVVSDEVLQTVLAEAEATVNSRPLTYVSSDKDDVEAITPNCFLMGTSSVKQPPGVFTDTDLSLKKKWRHCEVLKNHFWRRWLKEYVPTLITRKKWITSTKDLAVGDLVFVADSNLMRNNWPKGVVVEVYPGPDGHVRVADKTSTGFLQRPVVKLHRIILDKLLE